MIVRMIFGLCALSLAAGAATASQSSSKAPDDPNKIVCRTVAETGSRLNKTRACHTVAEWAELKRQTRSTVEHIQDSRPANLSN
jgi:hypothetical protein